jgi:hypothetical protein
MNWLLILVILAISVVSGFQSSSMRLDRVNIYRSVRLAKEALAELVTDGDGDGECKVKACCLCDRLIRHKKEKVLSLDRLRRLKLYFKPDAATDVARSTYGQTCYNTRGNPQYRFLRGMLLSPRSYKANLKDSKKTPGLGCCSECYSGMGSGNDHNNGHKKNAAAVLPKFAIANGWCIGSAPKCLTDLNEVEVAVISPARINKHVFAFQAGNHRTIQGWHSLYYNDLSHFEAVQEHVTAILKAPTISVVLVGPFTKSQKASTLARTTVRWNMVNKAIDWLKNHNHLYHSFVMPDPAHVQPIIVDER